jgi:hypothetical protein
MVQNMARTISRWIILAFPLLLLTGCKESVTPSHAKDASAPIHQKQKAREAFLEYTSGFGVRSRMKAAAELAADKAGEEWVVIILRNPAAGTPNAPSEALNQRQEITPFDRAVVAQILMTLPPHTSDAVLWAVTGWLSETNCGEYPQYEGGFMFGKLAEVQTPPIRDLARETLRRAMEVDMAYDADAWREAILKRAVDEAGP